MCSVCRLCYHLEARLVSTSFCLSILVVPQATFADPAGLEFGTAEAPAGDLTQEHPLFTAWNVGLSGTLSIAYMVGVYGVASSFSDRYVAALAINCGCSLPILAVSLFSLRAPHSRLIVLAKKVVLPVALAVILSDSYLFVAGAFCMC